MSDNNRTRCNREERSQSKTLSSHKNDVQSVAVGVSTLDYTGIHTSMAAYMLDLKQKNI